MAFSTKERRNGQSYSKNIVNYALTFNSGTWIVVSGTGTSLLTTNEYFEGTKSLLIQNNTPAIDLTVSNTNQTTTIEKSGNYQISLFLRKNRALEERQIDVLVYQNASLFRTETCIIGSTVADEDNNDVWVRYQADTEFNFNKGDEITFQFVLKSSPTSDPTTFVYIDALMINQSDRGDKIVPDYNSPNGDLYNNFTGWAVYNDTQYTTSSPFTIVDGAGVVDLPNNAGSKIESQLPLDVTTFYDGTVITGRNGDGVNITVEFKCRPTGTGTEPILKTTIDIGGSVGEIYPNNFILTRGNGVEHYYLKSFSGYTLDTWEANGGTVKISCENEDIEIYDIRYVISRTHKAR